MGIKKNTDYEHFFEFSQDLLCIAGTDGYFKELNPRWTEVLGWTREELLAKPFYEIIHPEDVGQTLSVIEKLGKGEPTIYFENRFLSKENTWVWLAWTATPSPDGTLYANARDVTQLKQLEDDLRNNILELSRSNEELEKFASIVSHDLKAPLRAISNLVEFINEDISEGVFDDLEDHSRLLKNRVKRMSRLIEDIFQYARIGRQMIRAEAIEPSELIAEVVENLDPPSGIKVEIQPGIPGIKGQRVRLQQVFSNLIGNGIKYMGKPEGTIFVLWKEQGDFIEFTVRDTGPGISAQYHEMVFVMFQRLYTKDEIEGTGIGLATVKKIVEDNAGTIRLESRPGLGSSFIFTWPKSVGK